MALKPFFILQLTSRYDCSGRSSEKKAVVHAVRSKQLMVGSTSRASGACGPVVDEPLRNRVASQCFWMCHARLHSRHKRLSTPWLGTGEDEEVEHEPPKPSLESHLRRSAGLG